MALRISSTNILMLFVISFPDISVSRSVESIGSSGYLAKEKFSGSHKLVRQISRDVNTFQNHVKKLKQVNGLKHHNVFNTHKDVGPLVYINNPLEAKVPKAYLTLNEFKQVIMDRVVRLKPNTRKNTVFWYTGKIAPTRTTFIGRNGNLDIKHNNWERNQDLANKRPLVEREITSIKSKIENDSRINREIKNIHKDIKYTTTATTKLKLSQHTKSHKTNIKPTFRSKGIKSVLKSRNNSISDNKRTVVRPSTAQHKTTITTMSSKINHPAIRISHASIHGTEDEIKLKDNKELSKTDVKEISGFKAETSSKTGEFGAIASDIKIFSKVTHKSAESNTKLPISSIATKVEIPSEIATEYANAIGSNKNKNSMTVNKSKVSSTVDKKEEFSIITTGTEKSSKTAIAEMENSSTTVTQIEKSGTTISEMEISSTLISELEKSSATITKIEESSTAITETKESSTAITETEESSKAITETEESSTAISETDEPSTAANDAGESDSTTTDTDEATTAEELVTTEVETSPTETEETTTVATEEPVTKRTWKPLSRPLVFMGKETL